MSLRTRLLPQADGTLVIERSQDVELLLERNKALCTADAGWNRSRDLRRAASIPLAVVEKWLNEEGIDVFDPNHAAAVRRKLNSSEYAHLRTAPGRL